MATKRSQNKDIFKKNFNSLVLAENKFKITGIITPRGVYVQTK
jgi:hypothetical protein